MAGGIDRAAVDPGPVADHRARVPGLSEVGDRGHGDQVPPVRMAHVFGSQVPGRPMAQGRVRLDGRPEETESKLNIALWHC